MGHFLAVKETLSPTFVLGKQAAPTEQEILNQFITYQIAHPNKSNLLYNIDTLTQKQ